LHSNVHAWYAVVMMELPKHRMTADEFLAWAEGLLPEDGKFELWDGEVVVRHGPGFEEERSEHWDAKGAMYWALHDAIKRAGLPCFAAVDGPMVRLSPNRMSRPDVLVYCGPKVPRGVREVPDPLILVEVLSRSTKKRDHGAKLEGYFSLTSLWHYLIVDPDRARLIHHKRGTAGAIEPHMVTGPRLQLDPPGLDVDLTEVIAS
jgi:Uma2 family endonuclease